jgi:hypothetical protein
MGAGGRARDDEGVWNGRSRDNVPGESPAVRRTRLRFRLFGLMIATALAVGTAILGLPLSGHFGATAPPQPPVQPRDSASIVVEADVKEWEPIFPDGPIDARKPDRQINVVKGNVIIGQHNWILRFKVARVVNGVFDSGEVHMLIHSPSEFGVSAPGQRFALCLSRHSEQPKVIASSSRRLSRGLSYFSFAQPLYELVSADARPAGRFAPHLEGQANSNPVNSDETVFLGTVTRIDNTGLAYDPYLRWVVTLKIDKMIQGSLAMETFQLAIHSPSREGVELGHQFRISVRKSKAGYDYCGRHPWLPVPHDSLEAK